jgi:hypothetical protein
MRNLILSAFIFLVIKAAGQCSSSVTPSSQTVTCAGGGSQVSFTSTIVGSTTTVIHEWYSPLSPPGVPVFTSSGFSSVLNGTYAPGSYTVISHNSNYTCVDSAYFVITSAMAYPTFNAGSPNNYSLGCAPLSQTTLSILNPISTQTLPSTCSYTFLAPGFSGSLTPNVVLSSNTSTLAMLPGTWTMVVQDNGNFCRSMLPVQVKQNTVSPNVAAYMLTNTLTCNNPTVQATGTSTTPNTNVTWIRPINPPTVNDSNLVLGPPNGPATSTTLLSYANYTVIAQNTNNACISSSVIIVYQNFRPPVSSPALALGSPTSASCSTVNPVILSIANSSVTSGGPGATLTNPCWYWPVPQTTTCGTPTYALVSPGNFMLTVGDSYNGCVATGTIYVPGNGIAASFAHTVLTGGVVNFSNTTLMTGTNVTASWNFGDGFTGTGSSIAHTYGSAGGWPVSLLVNNGQGCADTVAQSVNVTGIPCVANSGFSLAPTFTPQYWTVTPASPWNVTAANWSWGDGFTSNTLYTSHTYTSPGTYTVCLSVTVSCGGTSSTCVSQYISKSSQPGPMVYIQVVAPLTAGIKETEISPTEFSLFPNPGNGIFNFVFNGPISGKTRLLIYDLMGGKVYEGELAQQNSKNIYAVDLSGIKPGIYFASVREGDYAHVKKIIIEK